VKIFNRTFALQKRNREKDRRERESEGGVKRKEKSV
jgi:hypothetical protein